MPTCVEQGTTGLESVQGEHTGTDVYAGGQLQLRIGVRKGAGERIDTQATLAALALVKPELGKAEWLVPAMGSVMAPADSGSSSLREVTLTLVSAPSAAGDHETTLPPLPIVIRHASGAKVTLCTSEHKVAVHDPTDETSKTPRSDAPAVPEFETWVAARWAIAAACVLLPLLAWLVLWWHRRAGRATAVRGPQATPYQRASEAFAALGTQEAMATDRLADAATDAFRSYLEEAHSLRALECTTAELLLRLNMADSTRRHRESTEAWLTEADAIKFASKQLSPAERREFLAAGSALLSSWEAGP